MANETLITRIMGIAKAAIIDIESNYPNQLSYADSPEGGTAITGADSTLADILAWLESKGHTHSVRRAGSRYFCERLFWTLQPKQ